MDPWKVKQSKKLVLETIVDLQREHCPDCGAGNVNVTFRLKQPVGLEYYTRCRNCGREHVY